ncbi:MAG: amino acid permease [Nitrososphaerota archaeon]|nr:amino acid permease [Nitrososphaerota archaeon]
MQEQSLRREAGLFQVVTYGVGNIIGAGIYVLVGDASGLAGNYVWLAFLVGAVVALFTGLSYAELAAVYPKAASEYVFLGKAYGNRTLSFLTQWMMLVTEVVAAAAVALGFAGYLSTVVQVPLIPTAAALLVVVTVVALAGVRQSLVVNTVLSLVAVGGLLLVVGAGVGRFGSVSYTQSANGVPGILAATILVFFAYIGFDNISNLSEETKRPEKTVPRGLLISLSLSTILYILVGIASVSLVSWPKLSASEAPLALAVSTVLGRPGFDVLTVTALLTTLNTVLVLLMVSSRIIYGLGREGALPRVLGKVDKRTGAPIVASVFTLAVALAVLPLGQIGTIAKVTSFGSLLTFALVNVAMLHLRRVAPHLSRPFRVPLSVGWVSVTGLLGVVSCVVLLSQFDVLSFTLGMLLPVSGVALDVLMRGRGGLTSTDRSLHQPHEP